MAETHTRERFPRVAGRCPACHRESLRLYDGGHVGCSHLGCPDPSAAGDRLAVEGRPPRDATDPLPQDRWLIEVCVECGGAVCVTDPPHRLEHQSGVCSGWGCGGLRTVEVMPVPGAREDER